MLPEEFDPFLRGGYMSDRVDELASDVDDALTSVEELENDPGRIKDKAIHRVHDALKEAKDRVDEMEEAQE
jgi:outer membrane murein-binding lipoprotein Lpp